MNVKRLFAFFLLFNPLFALYTFNFSITETDNITMGEDYPNAEPYLMAYSDGMLYFSDTSTPYVFTYNGSDLETIMGRTLSYPSGVFVASNGSVYVADRGLGLVRHSPYKVMSEDSGYTGLDFLNGTFYISDYYYGRIVLLTEKGAFNSSFGSEGKYDNNFDKPQDLQIFNDSIYIADSGNGRVEKYSLSFQKLASYGNAKGGVVLKQPTGIFVDSDYVYVADYSGNQVVAYTHDGYPVYTYPAIAPRDVLVVGDIMYITHGDLERVISVSNISVPDPASSANDVHSSLEPAFSLYSSYAELCSQLNVSYNSTIPAEWANAEFALSQGNYGEAFYKMMDLNSTDISAAASEVEISLDAELSSLAQSSSAKSEILALVAEKRYSDAYSVYLNSSIVVPNVTTNETQEENDVFPLLDRLAEAERMIAEYKLNISTVAISAKIKSARFSDSDYNEAVFMLDAMDSEIDLAAYKINTALSKISELNAAIGKREFLADYSRAKKLSDDAAALAYSNPEEATRLAEMGLAEAKKSADSAQMLIYGLIAAFVLVAAAVAFALTRPRVNGYHFHKGKKE